MGRLNSKKIKNFTSINGNSKSIEVDLFTWEKLDLVDKLKNGLL